MPQNFPSLFRALRHRNYRVLFFGQAPSLIGTWMHATAAAWLAYRLTDSPSFLGLIAFVGQAPAFFLAPLGGVLADRWDKRRVLMATQALSLTQAFVLGVMTLTHRIDTGTLLILSLALGLVSALEVPTRQSLTAELVDDRADLSNAIALNSSLFNGARLIGPSIAGIVVATRGEALCFFLNAASYLSALAALSLVKIEPPVARRTTAPLADLVDGLRYAYRSIPLRAFIGTLAVFALAGISLPTLLPVFARDILGRGPEALGFLMGASGLGAMTAALYLAGRTNVFGLGRRIAAATAAFGVSVAALSFTRSFSIAVFLMFASGLAMMIHMAGINTLIQTLADDDKRGRVMSLFTAAFMGMTPFGSLAAGFLAKSLGTPVTLRLAGGVCFLLAGGFALALPVIRRHARPVLIQKGLLNDPAFNRPTG